MYRITASQWQRNLFDIPSSEISDAKITMTVFDARTVHQKEDE